MRDLFINLAAAIIVYVFGLVTTFIYKLVKLRGTRRIWSIFLGKNKQTSVILTDKPGTKARSPAKISLTDVQAYSDIRSVLQKLGGEIKLVTGSSATFEQLKSAPFISLGGPRYNGVTSQVIDILSNDLPVQFDTDKGNFLYGRTNYAAQYDPTSGYVTKDYGLVLRLIKSDIRDDYSCPALIAFGIHGHGTQQIVNSLISNKTLKRRVKAALNEDFWALVEFNFVDHKCTGSAVVAFGKMGRNANA